MNRLNKLIQAIILIVVTNIAITSTVYRFKHPEKTETEIFLHIPKSFIYNFK